MLRDKGTLIIVIIVWVLGCLYVVFVPHSARGSEIRDDITGQIVRPLQNWVNKAPVETGNITVRFLWGGCPDRYGNYANGMEFSCVDGSVMYLVPVKNRKDRRFFFFHELNHILVNRGILPDQGELGADHYAACAVRDEHLWTWTTYYGVTETKDCEQYNKHAV